MILWLSALCGFLLLVLVGALYVGARARADRWPWRCSGRCSPTPQRRQQIRPIPPIPYNKS